MHFVHPFNLLWKPSKHQSPANFRLGAVACPITQTSKLNQTLSQSLQYTFVAWRSEWKSLGCSGRAKNDPALGGLQTRNHMESGHSSWKIASVERTFKKQTSILHSQTPQSQTWHLLKRQHKAAETMKLPWFGACRACGFWALQHLSAPQ